MQNDPIRNVVFDFGGVLLNWRPQDVVAELFHEPAVQDSVMRSVFLHPDWLELDRGSLTEDQAIVRFADRSGVSTSLIDEMMERLRDSLNLLPDTAVLVQSLAGRGIPIYGLSNMSTQTFEMLRQRHEIWPLFNGIVISGDVGMVKPETGIFEHIVSKYSLVPAETVIVDDLAANVLAAHELGFQTILFRDYAECVRQLASGLGIDLP